jgi:hypothetical protein
MLRCPVIRTLHGYLNKAASVGLHECEGEIFGCWRNRWKPAYDLTKSPSILDMIKMISSVHPMLNKSQSFYCLLTSVEPLSPLQESFIAGRIRLSDMCHTKEGFWDKVCNALKTFLKFPKRNIYNTRCDLMFLFYGRPCRKFDGGSLLIK